MEQFVYKNQQRLRRGYTTGSCAAAAAKAAALGLLKGQRTEAIDITLPQGQKLTLPVLCKGINAHDAVFAVVKDGGDDYDVTDGMEIWAKVWRTPSGFSVDGGQGVGRVTKAGLACAIGEAAINPKPRAMISAALQEAAQLAKYTGGLAVEISAPEGERVAKNTFNPRLGIVGGISILGTSGIVEPMSEQALIDTIKVELQMCRAAGRHDVLITPGNYGEAFAKIDSRLGVAQAVKCSNFLGETLDMAVALGFRGVLLVGHAGKLVKVAAGVMNTHSKYADCRMEVLTAHAALAGADRKVAEAIMGCVTTDEATAILQSAGIAQAVWHSVLEKIDFHLKARVKGSLKVGAMMFSNVYGLLGQTADAAELASYFRGGA